MSAASPGKPGPQLRGPAGTGRLRKVGPRREGSGRTFPARLRLLLQLRVLVPRDAGFKAAPVTTAHACRLEGQGSGCGCQLLVATPSSMPRPPFRRNLGAFAPDARVPLRPFRWQSKRGGLSPTLPAPHTPAGLPARSSRGSQTSKTFSKKQPVSLTLTLLENLVHSLRGWEWGAPGREGGLHNSTRQEDSDLNFPVTVFMFWCHIHCAR